MQTDRRRGYHHSPASTTLLSLFLYPFAFKPTRSWDQTRTEMSEERCSELTRPSSNTTAASNSCGDSPSRHQTIVIKSAQGSSSSAADKKCNTTSGKGVSGARNGRKRVMANERERERTKSLNQALEILRNRLPAPEAEKRSKIQTLRMAKRYIEFLAKLKRISQQQAVDGANNNNLTIDQQIQNHPDILTYKFYKFRLESQND